MNTQEMKNYMVENHYKLIRSGSDSVDLVDNNGSLGLVYGSVSGTFWVSEYGEEFFLHRTPFGNINKDFVESLVETYRTEKGIVTKPGLKELLE